MVIHRTGGFFKERSFFALREERHAVTRLVLNYLYIPQSYDVVELFSRVESRKAEMRRVQVQTSK